MATTHTIAEHRQDRDGMMDLGAIWYAGETGAALSSAAAPAVLSWGEGSELRSMKRFFMQKGINKNPSDFTYAKIFESRVLARQRAAENDREGALKSYPSDLIMEDQKLAH